jgi:hypothetical protein
MIKNQYQLRADSDGLHVVDVKTLCDRVPQGALIGNFLTEYILDFYGSWGDGNPMCRTCHANLLSEFEKTRSRKDVNL